MPNFEARMNRFKETLPDGTSAEEFKAFIAENFPRAWERKQKSGHTLFRISEYEEFELQEFPTATILWFESLVWNARRGQQLIFRTDTD